MGGWNFLLQVLPTPSTLMCYIKSVRVIFYAVVLCVIYLFAKTNRHISYSHCLDFQGVLPPFSYLEIQPLRLPLSSRCWHPRRPHRQVSCPSLVPVYTGSKVSTPESPPPNGFRYLLSILIRRDCRFRGRHWSCFGIFIRSHYLGLCDFMLAKRQFISVYLAETLI